jgi:streptogramin lyase
MPDPNNTTVSNPQTLVRLAIWLPDQHTDTLTEFYETQIRGLMEQHLFAPMLLAPRVSAAEVFSRFFTFKTPTLALQQQEALYQDAAWHELMHGLERLGGDQVYCQVGIYQTPAGSGKAVDAGPGSRRGPWYTFNGQDGLPSTTVRGILADQKKQLWFATDGGGVCRYDGDHVEILVQGENHLGKGVWCILEDRHGRVWFGTLGRGVYCLDGEEMTRYSTEDGLANDWVHAILEDQDGRMWFGTFGGGISCFDGQVFQTLSSKDGLPHDSVQDILQDRQGAMWIAICRAKPCLQCA